MIEALRRRQEKLLRDAAERAAGKVVPDAITGEIIVGFTPSKTDLLGKSEALGGEIGRPQWCAELADMLWDMEHAVFHSCGRQYRRLGLTILSLTGGYDHLTEDDAMQVFGTMAKARWMKLHPYYLSTNQVEGTVAGTLEAQRRDPDDFEISRYFDAGRDRSVLG